MKTKFKSSIHAGCLSFGVGIAAAVFLQSGAVTASAQTGDYLYSGSETTINLGPGLYDISTYGAQGGSWGGGGGGGLGAEMEGEFSFSGLTTLTLLVGGAGGSEGGGGDSGGGGAGGSGDEGGGGDSGGYADGGDSFLSGGSGGAVNANNGGTGGGGWDGGGGGGGDFLGGGGGGSIIDSSGTVLAEISGIANPDDSPNGEIIITAVPEPSTLALAGLSGLSLMLFRRPRK